MNYKLMVIVLLVGLIGATIGHGIWHLYNDHVMFHGLINSIIQQQNLQKQTK